MLCNYILFGWNPTKQGALHVNKTSIVDYIIKMEDLNSSLLDFATIIKPEFFSTKAVHDYLSAKQQINVSTLKLSDIGAISEENLKKIQQKESLLLQFY